MWRTLGLLRNQCKEKDCKDNTKEEEVDLWNSEKDVQNQRRKLFRLQNIQGVANG